MEQAARSVTLIPPTIDPQTHMSIAKPAKRRVAGYARVSTDSEEQLTSYEAQVDYYTRYIQSKPEWDYVGLYTDEGISAVSTKRREGFNRMVQDALDGKIDLIITKSVSRFARNTVDSLVTVRKLKEKGVEVYFEKENIYTLDSKGELLITIMSSLAQEESRSISENVTWGQRKRFADGKVSLPYSHFLGYGRGEDGLPQVIEEEAETVRRIYRLFIGGKTANAIARILTQAGVSTPAGKQKWQPSTVESILTNEKYRGSALLQKRFTVDFLAKKIKFNEGEVPQYWVEHSHEAIIEPEEFDRVQTEFAKRKSMGHSYSTASVFSTHIVCGDCGGYYGAKVWHSTDKYRRVVWQCNAKFKNEERCHTPHLSEEEIKTRFLAAFNTLLQNRESLLDDCRLMQTELTDCSAIDATLAELKEEMTVVEELIRKCIAQNAQDAQDQKEYDAHYDGLVNRYDAAKARLTALEKKKADRAAKAAAMGGFISELKERDEALTEFDDALWRATVEKATVMRDGRLVFALKSGMEISHKPQPR